MINKKLKRQRLVTKDNFKTVLSMLKLFKKKTP